MTDQADHKTLAEALAAFQAETPTFKKSKTAEVPTKAGGKYTYKYADLADIIPIVGPLLAKHGLSWSAKIGRADGELVLRYILRHVSGEADSDEMPLSVPANCKPQELGSAITYMRRYAMTAQLNIATEEDDDGSAAQKADRTANRRTAAPEPEPEPVLLDENSVREVLAAIKKAAAGPEWVRGQLVAVGVQHVPEGALTKGIIQRLTGEQAVELVKACDAYAEVPFQ